MSEKPLSLSQLRTRVELLEKEQDFHRSVFEAMYELCLVLDEKGAFLKMNPKAIEWLGYPWEELQQKIFMDIIAQEDLEKLRKGFEEMQQGKEVQLMICILTRSGNRIPADFLGILRDGSYIVFLQDSRERMSKEKELGEKTKERDQYARELKVLRDLYREKLKEIEKMREEAVLLSYTDDLTGIYNHRFFIQQLTMEVERQKRYFHPLSLLMIDIDYFKNYNDTNGHLAGDQVLKAISILIQHGVRQTDIVARYGGEEFSAILINAGREEAKEIGERVRRNVAETYFPNEGTQPNGDLTISIGVATFTPSIATLTELIREADNALYRAKRAGRNRVEE
jgi:diguanylate cyclase (GGDEF)-like protein/PAS domain S-box-containing protein